MDHPKRLSWVQRYTRLDPDDKLLLLDDLRENGYLDIAEILEAKSLYPNNFQYICPVTNVELSAPCGLTSCRFWASHIAAGNCLNVYLKDQNVEGLEVHEIAFLHRVDPQDVKDTLAEALSQLRGESIRVAIRDMDLIPEFTIVRSDKICCVCGDPIESYIPAKLRVSSVGVAYCGDECKQLSSPCVIEIEAKFGLPIGVVLKWVMSHFKQLPAVEQALGINRWVVNDLLQKYLDKSLGDYFPRMRKTDKRKKLTRRTWHYPHWIDKLLDEVKPAMAQIFAKHGPPSIDGNKIRIELQELVEQL